MSPNTAAAISLTSVRGRPGAVAQKHTGTHACPSSPLLMNGSWAGRTRGRRGDDIRLLAGSSAGAGQFGPIIRPGPPIPGDLHTFGTRSGDDPAEAFLYRAGQTRLGRYVPCSVARAALGVSRVAPGWALEVPACRRHYQVRDHDAEATIGDIAATARDRLHEAVAAQVAGAGVLRSENWAHLLSPTCNVLSLPRRRSVPEYRTVQRSATSPAAPSGAKAAQAFIAQTDL